MVDRCTDRQGATVAQAIRGDDEYKEAVRTGNFPVAFGRAEAFIGRNALEAQFRDDLGRLAEPSEVTHELADWPFVGYITTNYDDSLRRALQRTPDKAWTLVGNTDEEARKIAGAASGVIWHLHGHIEMPDKSRLIITEDDYDSIYLADHSPVLDHLQALLTQRRLVFIGFGFRDAELMRVLKKVGLLTSPARPLFAFMPDSTSRQGVSFANLLTKYNVDSIPYQIRSGGSHSQLKDLLRVYGSMILVRKLTFGHERRQVPSYDPETTGLLIFNELALGETVLPGAVHRTLLRARIVSVLSDGASHPEDKLVQELAARSTMLRTAGDSKSDKVTIRAIAEELVEKGLASLSTSVTGDAVQLTAVGIELVRQQAAKASLSGDQFKATLLGRAAAVLSDHPAASRVADVAEDFVKECLERRALGIAMAQLPGDQETHSYHMVGLLRELPTYLSQLTNQEEAIALTKVLQGLLGAPTQAELQYMGLATQARFGVHLLGYDPDALLARWKDVSETAFVVDSSSLIPYLAVGSPGYPAARMMVERLKDLGALVTTTRWLTHEVAEHVTWALEHAGGASGSVSVKTLRAAAGRAGDRANAFIEGFVAEVDSGRQSLAFDRYLERCLPGWTVADTCGVADVQQCLEGFGTDYRDFARWTGFKSSMYSDREDLASEIARCRGVTYRHERQVRAEAEAAIIVQAVRSGRFTSGHRKFANAYFISKSRAIDEAVKPRDRVTMKPEAVIHWVATMGACSTEELTALTASLLWELSEFDLAIVDDSKLRRVFSPLVSASRDQLQEELLKHRDRVEERFGLAGTQEIENASDLDVPVVLTSLHVQRLTELEAQLEEERKARAIAEKSSRITAKEREELARLQQNEKARRRRAQKDRNRPTSKRKKGKR